MALLVLGINHRSASIRLREKLAFHSESLPNAISSLRSLPDVREAVILSTCNRTEIYCICSEKDSSPVLSWLSQHHELPLIEFSDKAYEFWDSAALRHIMEVSCGLDSMVIGEPQIFGQMKSAYSVAQGANALGSELPRIFQHIFATAKRVRTETELGAHPVSLAFVSLNLAKRIFSDIGKTKVLLIGAGEMIELVAKHFNENGIEHISVANRTLEKADTLARKIGGRGLTLGDLPKYLSDMDIIITSTAAPIPVLGKGLVESAIKQRKHRPMFMVDLAVPRDVEPEVSELNDVYLYTVDDLQDVINENLKNRESAGAEAKFIIDKAAAEFQSKTKERNAVGTLKAYRSKVESLREESLSKALESLGNGVPPEQVLERFSKDFSQKIMHEPSVGLKQAAIDEQLEFIEWSKTLFGLNANEVSDFEEFRKSNKGRVVARERDKK